MAMLVNTDKGKLLKEVVKCAEAEFAALGMVKKKGLHMLPLTENASGVVGLNLAMRRGDSRVGINPVIGVRHEEIERMIERLSGSKESRLMDTLNTSLGYVMPEGRYLEWLFEPAPFDYLSECKKMVEAIETYGIPFMKSHGTLEAIVSDLQRLRFTSKDTAVYRLPVAYLLSGKTELAGEYVKKQITELGNRNDVAAQEYRTFASNLLQEAALGK
jgi:hypothetical protein